MININFYILSCPKVHGAAKFVVIVTTIFQVVTMIFGLCSTCWWSLPTANFPGGRLRIRSKLA